MIVGIIGAGASGMTAALAAAENPNVQVLLFERQSRVGKKLLATGNGRCNLTNLLAGEKGYHGDDTAFSKPALQSRNPESTLAWFRSLGLYTVTEPSGRVYPYSDQANSVVDVLRLALKKPNITLHTACEIEKISRDGEGFLLTSSEGSYRCQRLVVACGGLAGTKQGGSMSGYKLLGKLGHKSTRLRPSLVQIKSHWRGIAALKGVRCNCHAEIYRDGELFAQSNGEIQFTDYGLSGPVIFEISRDVCHGSGHWCARLDFLPDCTVEALMTQMLSRQDKDITVDDLLTGILHNRLGRVLTKELGIAPGRAVSQLSQEEIRAVAIAAKCFEISLHEPMGMDSAQVTAGGIHTKCFNPNTLESYLVPGLFACGEILDVDGDCGGYNLQWAWSSGYVAGKNAGKEVL